jgi:hypothetical protein
VTSDESEFLEHYDHERMWHVSADEVPTRVRPTIVTSKMMLTVFLSARRVIFINGFHPGGKFDRSSFFQDLLEPLA